MVNPMSEEGARAALSAVRSPAADPSKYDARRLEGGWLFGWSASAGRPPMDTRSWVVADTGEARRLTLKALAEDVLRGLNGA